MVKELNCEDQNRAADQANDYRSPRRYQIATCRYAHQACKHAVEHH